MATIITKNSSTASAVPLAGSLVQGELAVNVTDKKVYTKDSANAVVKLVGSLGNQEANAVTITGGTISGTTVSGSANFDVQRFSGDGTTTVFTLGVNPLSENNTQVYINGVYQQKDTYSVVGTALTFSEAPVADTDNIEVVTTSMQAIGTTTSDLVSYTPAGTGSVATNVQTKLRESVSVKDFGAVGDGVADDSVAFQAAIDYLESVGGGTLLCKGKFLVGGLEINSRYINVCGTSENDEIIVKNGTTGIRVKQHWVNFRDLTIKSQGTKTDGLGTNGINYQQATQTSIGYVLNENLTISGFSGTGLKVNNAINFVAQRIYVASCTTGIHFARDGTGAGNFSTTVDLENVYVSSCTTGVKGDRVYRSRFNVIGEYCTYAMDMNIGAFTLLRCYFENNTTLGARIVDCEAQDLFTYSNDATLDAVSITFTGATAAADRGYLQLNKADTRTKRLGVLSQYGVDLKYLDAHGTTSNLGLKYGENTVALVRGTNLFNEAAWAPNRLSELIGWDLTNQGYKIAGTSGGDTTYGMKQDITLSTSKTYVIDLRTTTVTGSGVTLIKVGATQVTSGVPFVPPVDGVNTVKCYGIDTLGTAFECYVNVFTIAEVVADVSQIAEANARLTRIKGDRGTRYATAAPTAGRWMQGEIIYNSAPTASGFIGWVCTASGAPGTWKTFGAISA